MTKRVKKFSGKKKKSLSVTATDIASACNGLIYISETDAPLTPFSFVSTDKDILGAVVDHFKLSDESKIESRPPETFFDRLIVAKEWHDDKQRSITARFADLYKMMTANLVDMTVLRSGEIRVDIYVAGRTKNGEIVGFRTQAVET